MKKILFSLFSLSLLVIPLQTKCDFSDVLKNNCYAIETTIGFALDHYKAVGATLSLPITAGSLWYLNNKRAHKKNLALYKELTTIRLYAPDSRINQLILANKLLQEVGFNRDIFGDNRHTLLAKKSKFIRKLFRRACTNNNDEQRFGELTHLDTFRAELANELDIVDQIMLEKANFVPTRNIIAVQNETSFHLTGCEVNRLCDFHGWDKNNLNNKIFMACIILRNIYRRTVDILDYE